VLPTTLLCQDNKPISQILRKMEKLNTSPEIQNHEKVPDSEKIMLEKQPTKPAQVDDISSSVGTSSNQDEPEYITGMKLGLVIGAVSLCSFLMLLDTSIVVTVRLDAPRVYLIVLMLQTGYSKNHQRLFFT